MITVATCHRKLPGPYMHPQLISANDTPHVRTNNTYTCTLSGTPQCVSTIVGIAALVGCHFWLPFCAAVLQRECLDHR